MVSIPAGCLPSISCRLLLFLHGGDYIQTFSRNFYRLGSSSSSSSSRHQTVLGIGQNAGSASTKELLDDLDELNDGDDTGARAVGLKREREEEEVDDDKRGLMDGSGSRKVLRVKGVEKKEVVDVCLGSEQIRECMEKTTGLLEREFNSTQPLSGDISGHLRKLFETHQSSQDGWNWRAQYREEAKAAVRLFGKRMQEAGAKHLTDLLNKIACKIQQCQ
jgi:hypothetical protein